MGRGVYRAGGGSSYDRCTERTSSCCVKGGSSRRRPQRGSVGCARGSCPQQPPSTRTPAASWGLTPVIVCRFFAVVGQVERQRADDTGGADIFGGGDGVAQLFQARPGLDDQGIGSRLDESGGLFGQRLAGQGLRYVAVGLDQPSRRPDVPEHEARFVACVNEDRDHAAQRERPPEPVAGQTVTGDEAGDRQRRIGGEGRRQHGGAGEPPGQGSARGGWVIRGPGRVRGGSRIRRMPVNVPEAAVCVRWSRKPRGACGIARGRPRFDNGRGELTRRTVLTASGGSRCRPMC